MSPSAGTPPIIRASAKSLTKLKDVRLIQTSIERKKISNAQIK